MEKVVIVSYGAGNVKSVYNAVKRLHRNATITSDIREVAAADKVIFPGVGHAQTAMQQLEASGLDLLIPTLTAPLLGICLGMQLLVTSTEEGETQALNCIAGDVVKMDSDLYRQRNLKVPHMGWNRVYHLSNPLFKGIESGTHFYFVHGYYLPIVESTVATVDYYEPFSAAIAHKNLFGCQFHPEKSSEQGEQLLLNFLTL